MEKKVKTKEIRAKFTEEAYTKIQEKAESNGLTVGSYVRMVLMNMAQ